MLENFTKKKFIHFFKEGFKLFCYNRCAKLMLYCASTVMIAQGNNNDGAIQFEVNQLQPYLMSATTLQPSTLGACKASRSN